MYIFGAVWLIGMSIALFRPDPIIDQVFNELTIESEYELHRFSSVKYKFDQQGNLGEMYLCLSKYRGSSKRKPKSPNDVALGKFVEIKSKNYVFRLEISAGEAYKMEITELDEQEEVINSSNSYAVNCELALLNS